MGVLKRIRDYAAVTVFGVLTMMSGPLMEIAHADLKGVELTADTQLPMWVVSTSSLSVSSTTSLSAIPNLAQDLVAGETYTCTSNLHGTSGTTGGVAVAFIGTNGLAASPVTVNAFVYNGASVVSKGSAASLGTSFVNFKGAYTDILVDATFTATASGRLSLQAAQNTADPTATTIIQGSTMSCIHVGTQVLVVQPGTPPMAAPTTSNGTYNYATACGGSCLVAEDQFTSTSLSSLWVPYVANALGGSWALSNGGSNLLFTSPYSASHYTPPCSASSSTTSPVYSSCGEAFSYFNAFPYGTGTNNNDGQHLLGGNANGNALTIAAMPGLSTTTETSTLGGGTVSAFGRGAVWTSGAVSSAHPGSLVLPATGGYVQVRAKLPNTLSGAQPSIVLFADGGGSNDSGNEIDIQQGGFYFGGTAANNVAHPPNNMVNATYRPTGFVGTVTGCTSSNSPDIGAITCSGTPPDLEKTVHVQGDTNNAIIADGGFICTILSANSVQLCQDGTSTPLTIGTITSGNTLQYGYHEVGQEFCAQSNVTNVDQFLLHVGCQTDLGVDLTAGYHVYGIEYLPGQSITIWADGNMIAQYTGYGVGTSAYDIALYVDMVNPTGITWRSVADWPSAEPVGTPPSERYAMQVNDVQVYQVPTSTSMAAPSIAANTAALGNYSNSCNGNGTSCLLFEDQFNGTTIPANHGGSTSISDLWVPYLANGVGGGGVWHRWNAVEVNSTNTGTTQTPAPFTGDRNCSTSGWSTTNPPWSTCLGPPNIDNYYNPFPYGTSINAGDGNHLLGGTSNGNKLSLVLTPGKPTAVLPADGLGDSAVNAFADGHVWTSAGISSNNPNTTAVNGQRAMICPSTGCYVQWRTQQPDCTKGAWMGIGFYMSDASIGSGTNEFDVDECGFNWFGNAAQTPPNVNYVSSSTMQGNGYTVCNTALGAFSSGSPAAEAGNPSCQVNLGVDLSQNYHVWGIEYNPNNWFKVYLDGNLVGTYQSSSGNVGNRAYSIYIDMDMALGGSNQTWRSKHDWPTTTTNCCTSPPNEAYTANINDVQLFKLPGQ